MIQGRYLEPESSHMCLASSDSLFLYSSHHPTTAIVGPVQGNLSICIPPALAALDNSTWKKKAEMYWTLGLGVCEHVWGAFQGTGSYDGVPGWEESLRPSKPVLRL